MQADHCDGSASHPGLGVALEEGSGLHACNCPPPPEGVVRPDDHGRQVHRRPRGRVDAEGRPFLTTVRNEPPAPASQVNRSPSVTAGGDHLRKWQATYDLILLTCAQITASVSEIAIRNSKDPGGGTVLFTAMEWEAFLGGVKTGEFDILVRAPPYPLARIIGRGWPTDEVSAQDWPPAHLVVLGVSVRLEPPGTRDCVDPGQEYRLRVG